MRPSTIAPSKAIFDNQFYAEFQHQNWRENTMQNKFIIQTFMILLASWQIGYSQDNLRERESVVQNYTPPTYHDEKMERNNRIFTIRQETVYGLGAGALVGRNWITMLPIMYRYPLRSAFMTSSLLCGTNYIASIYGFDRQKLAISFLMGFGLTAPFALMKDIKDAARRGALI